jgi:hypothetical protein
MLSNCNWNRALAEDLYNKPMRLYINKQLIATLKMNSKEADNYIWRFVVEFAGLEEGWLADIYIYMRENCQIGAEVEEMISVITCLQNILKGFVGNIRVVGYNNNCIKLNIGQL